MELNSREGKVFLEGKFCGEISICPTKTLLAHFPFYSPHLSDNVRRGVALLVSCLFHLLIFGSLKYAPPLAELVLFFARYSCKCVSVALCDYVLVYLFSCVLCLRDC